MNKPVPLKKQDRRPPSGPARNGPGDTRERILDVAEKLFSESGFAATSLREITSVAGVNLAAVNYHFGSKEALVDAVFERRLAPLNRDRIAALDALEITVGAYPLRVGDILRAFVHSAFHRSGTDTASWVIFLRLLGRAFTEPTEPVRTALQRQYGEVAERYKAALARALPHLPDAEVAWRMQFMFGTVSYVMAGADTLACVASCRLDDVHDLDAVTQRLIVFLKAGLEAPVTELNAPVSGDPLDPGSEAGRRAA